MVQSGGGAPFGFIAAGFRTLLRGSKSDARFHGLLAASISHGVSNAAAHAEEKRKAEGQGAPFTLTLPVRAAYDRDRDSDRPSQPELKALCGEVS